jgi:predicted ATPase
MITKLNLTNFKAFESANVTLKPITIFLGPNNSGKSSVLAPFRMLSQTIQSYDPTVPLLLNGIMGDFGTYKDVVYANKKARHIEINCKIKPKRRVVRSNGEVLSRSLPSLSMSLKFKFRSSIREIILKELKIIRGNKERFLSKYSEDSEKHIIQKINGTLIPQSHKAYVSKRMSLFHFLPRSVFQPRVESKSEETSAFLNDEMRSSLNMLPRICNDFYKLFFELEYVGAMRLPPSRTYMFSGERNRKVGSQGEYATNIIAMDSIRKGSKSKGIRRKVVSWLQKAGIASDIKIVALSDRHYELHVQNPITKEYQNFADVGYGNSQVIPVLVGGYNLEESSVYIVEEPEIHLHPKAQAELGDFFLDLHKKNIQTLVETHSEHLVVRLQQHVAAGILNPNDIAFYYVYADKNQKNVFELNLDKKGQFVEKWPEGFFPERLEEAKKLAKLRNRG